MGKTSSRTQRGVSRRALLRSGVASGIVVAAGGGAVVSAGAVGGSEPQDVPPGPLDERSVAELQAWQGAGKATARSLCESYLARIAALDGQLRSIIEVNPDALAIADRLDRERKDKGPRGPLHGIPVVVKDNIATADRMETTAGSLALVGARPKKDATVAARLRSAGAVILAKTNLSEWANFRSSHSSSGWSGRGGQCRNPYALDRSPCGSSSGTAAAIAASLAAVGVGTETDGSIVCPSAHCSLVGIKPTLGAISRTGIVPIAHSQDTAGPMARTVADAAALLGALVGEDARDAATAASAGKLSRDYTAFLDRGGLKGARIGVARAKFFGYSPETDAVVEAALRVMAGLGAVLVDPADIPHAGEVDDDELEVLLYEFKSDLNDYLADLGPGAAVHSLADVIAFNEAHRAQELPYFGQDLMIKAEGKGPLTEKAYLKALSRCRELSREKGLGALFAAHTLDAVVAPTGGPPWMIDLVTGDHFGGSSSTPAAVSGYPSVTLPAGYVFGLPVGVTLIGQPWSEPALIRMAFALEQALAVRRPPRFLATADLTVR
ncbi:MAG: amidase [Acidobacteriota bacterium]